LVDIRGDWVDSPIDKTQKENLMAVPSSKSELIADIQSTYKKLKGDLVDIPPEMTEQKSMPGHIKDTEMSLCNLLSYLVGWGNLVLKWHRISSQGKMPDLYDTGYKMNELGRLAQKFYRDYENDDFQTLQVKLDQVVKEILSMVEGMDNKDLYEIPWHGKYPFGRMVQFNTSSPYKNARSRIRKWKRENGLM
jgi:hypothetical protein